MKSNAGYYETFSFTFSFSFPFSSIHSSIFLYRNRNISAAFFSSASKHTWHCCFFFYSLSFACLLARSHSYFSIYSFLVNAIVHFLTSHALQRNVTNDTRKIATNKQILNSICAAHISSDGHTDQRSIRLLFLLRYFCRLWTTSTHVPQQIFPSKIHTYTDTHE